MRHTLPAWAALLSTHLALAQPPTPPSPAAPQPAPDAATHGTGPKQVALAAAFLGQRVLANRVQTPVAPLLVIVPDEGSYLAALKHWGAGTRFPVLIDDTSLPARQDIARFARAFKPASIVRFRADPLPAAGEGRRRAILDTLYAIWKSDSAESYAAALAARILPGEAPAAARGPLGIVAASDADPAWTAALALAAAHGQLLAFPSLTLPAANATLTMADADRLNAALLAAAADARLTHAGLGDQIDALTLCLNIPLKVTVGASDAPRSAVAQLNAKAGEALALTDLIGRNPVGPHLDRWAWSAQIIGSSRQAACRAMCAVFLQPQDAFLFDGYDADPGFRAFDATAAGQVLRAAGIPPLVIDAPRNTADNWRLATAGAFATIQRRAAVSGGTPLPDPAPFGGLRAGLVCVNTMGNHDFFQLGNNSKCRAADVPILQVPALLHFVHSWSLTHGPDSWTVGGRWLDHGAYACVGSVHEPYLAAFVPTPAFCTRLTDHVPLAVAARIADGPFAAPWRITVLGDPLLTLGPPAPAAEKMPALPGTTDLAAEPQKWAKAKRYDLALDALMMLNRHADAARLAAAALADDPDSVTSAAALRGVLAAFDAGDFDTLAQMGARIDSPGDRDFLVADAIWQAFWPSLAALNADQARLLSRTLRPYNFAQDALNAALALARTDSPAAARAFYDTAKSKATRADIKKDMAEFERLLPR